MSVGSLRAGRKTQSLMVLMQHPQTPTRLLP